MRWKWVAISGGAVFAVKVAVLALVIGFYGEDILERIAGGTADGGTVMRAVLAVLGGYFLAGAGVAYLSPGLTLKEPAIGAALAVGGDNLLSGSGGQGVLVAWVLPYFLALAGARLGERLQGPSRSTRAGLSGEPRT
jgi:hypothetical protein